MAIRFEWDQEKSKQNLKKHGVSFEEAQTVFFDEDAIRFFDPDHSGHEDRFLMLGMSWRLRLLAVHYTIRERGRQIRIISARKATKHEQAEYYRSQTAE